MEISDLKSTSTPCIHIFRPKRKDVKYTWGPFTNYVMHSTLAVKSQTWPKLFNS